MRRGMKKARSLKSRSYAAHLVDLKKYLDSFPRVILADKIDITKLNEIILNSTPNSWSKQSYVQGSYCESISFKNAVNIFERMEIA